MCFVYTAILKLKKLGIVRYIPVDWSMNKMNPENQEC